MLVLSRKVGQELVIGDNIRVTVNRVGGSRVTLGISAPDDIRIVRGELDPIVRSFEVEVELEDEPAVESVAESIGQATGEPTADVRESAEKPEQVPFPGTWRPADQMGLINYRPHTH